MSYVTNRATDIQDMPRGGFDASCLDRLLETSGPIGTRSDPRRVARIALQWLADVPDPRILVIGDEDGAVSRQLCEDHPTARVASGDSESEHDLALLAVPLHQLSPAQAARVFVEGTRAARTLLIVDSPRPPAPLHLLGLAAALPAAPWVSAVRAGIRTSLCSYSTSALRSLAAQAGATVDVRGGFLGGRVVTCSSQAAGTVHANVTAHSTTADPV